MKGFIKDEIPSRWDENQMTHDIKTQSGKDMFKYFNDNYGSSIWGPVLEGIKAIEKELQ